MSDYYKLYLDKTLVDETFSERIDEGDEFEISKNWVCTTSFDEADAYLVPEETLGEEGSFKDRAALKPIICVNPQEQPTEFEIKDLDYDVLVDVLKDVEPIVDRLHHLHDHEVVADGDPFLMGLAFIWSRGKALNPLVDKNLEKGIWYPYFDTHIFDSSGGAETLSFLKNSGFLSSHINEVAQACPKCSGIVILLRDGCIDCGSVDVIEENMIHHFVCGYQAASSRFLIHNEELMSELWCPKCQKPLRHYGVDYDKPSLLYRCQKCHHENAETRVIGKCLSCHEEFPGEESPRREIKRYEITNLGVKALFEKEVNLFNLRKFLGQYVDVIPFDNFVMMAQKLSHVREELPLTILKLSLQHDEGGEVDDEMLSDSRLILDIGKNIAHHIRKSDAVTLYRGRLYILFIGGEHIEKNVLMQKEGLTDVFTEEVIGRLNIDQMTLQEFVEGYIGK